MSKKRNNLNLDDLYLLNQGSRKRKDLLLLNDLKRESQKEEAFFFDLPMARYVLRTKKKSTLLILGKKNKKEQFFLNQRKRTQTFSARVIQRNVDGLFFEMQKQKSKQVHSIYLVGRDVFLEEIKERYSNLSNFFSDLVRGSIPGVSLARAWNVSIISAVIFGMVTMTFIYRYLGESVLAKIDQEKEKIAIQEEIEPGKVLGINKENADMEEADFITKLIRDYEKSESEGQFEKEIRAMVKGYPIETMVPEIVKKDKVVAAFLISIAKKESNWGKRVPVLKGQDCYNYWGYRGIRKRMGTGGHTCFDSPKDAVDTVAKRIEFLVSSEKLKTPEKMVVWKCGYDCSWDNPVAVRKWISDVNLYFKQLNK